MVPSLYDNEQLNQHDMVAGLLGRSLMLRISRNQNQFTKMDLTQ